MRIPLGQLLLLCGTELVEKDAQIMKAEETAQGYMRHFRAAIEARDEVLTECDKLKAELDVRQKEVEQVRKHRDWLDEEMRKICHVLTGFDNYNAFDMIGQALDAKADIRRMEYLNENYISRGKETALNVITSCSVDLRQATDRALPIPVPVEVITPDAEPLPDSADVQKPTSKK